jgi:hypothetical protein
MSKNNNHKKRVFQDNFIHNWTTSAHNHPSGWSWWKRHTRKLTRKQLKKELQDEYEEILDEGRDFT